MGPLLVAVALVARAAAQGPCTTIGLVVRGTNASVDMDLSGVGIVDEREAFCLADGNYTLMAALDGNCDQGFFDVDCLVLTPIPSYAPTPRPTPAPTVTPAPSTAAPSVGPTASFTPTANPTALPTARPTFVPTYGPTSPTAVPTSVPTSTAYPTMPPTFSYAPTALPTYSYSYEVCEPQEFTIDIVDGGCFIEFVNLTSSGSSDTCGSAWEGGVLFETEAGDDVCVIPAVLVLVALILLCCCCCGLLIACIRRRKKGQLTPPEQALATPSKPPRGDGMDGGASLGIPEEQKDGQNNIKTDVPTVDNGFGGAPEDGLTLAATPPPAGPPMGSVYDEPAYDGSALTLIEPFEAGGPRHVEVPPPPQTPPPGGAYAPVVEYTPVEAFGYRSAPQYDYHRHHQQTPNRTPQRYHHHQNTPATAYHRSALAPSSRRLVPPPPPSLVEFDPRRNAWIDPTAPPTNSNRHGDLLAPPHYTRGQPPPAEPSFWLSTF